MPAPQPCQTIPSHLSTHIAKPHTPGSSIYNPPPLHFNNKLQVLKIVGVAAPEVFVQQVERLAEEFDSAIQVDVTRAYHFGSRYNVEME